MKENTTRRYRVPLLLPVRTKVAPWQTIKTWFHQLWQRWHTPLLRVQPPLQPGRHKPFSQRPHQARRQTVFAALDAAPAGLTRRQLIAHVRTVTGIGCSEKLITQWRQERAGDGATRQARDAAKGRRADAVRRKRMVQLRLFLVCAVLGATLKPWHPSLQVGAQEITISPAPSASPTIANFPSQVSNPPGPRLLRIKLTLHSPRELRIKVGDEVNAGDVLSDQTNARRRLLLQKHTLESFAYHLQTQARLTAQSLQHLNSLGFHLPPASLAAEQAAITKAEAEAVAVNRAVEIQRQKIAVVGDWWPVIGKDTPSSLATERHQPATSHRLPITNSPPPITDHQSFIIEHETAKLTQAQERQALAQADIELQRAKLTTAREARAFAEQQHRVDVTRQLLNARSQQQQAEIERARLTANIAELDLQLSHLTAIRAPFTGTIKRIEWEEMNNEKLTVVVYLSVAQ
jgi:biotin carboxyl carrier protein